MNGLVNDLSHRSIWLIDYLLLASVLLSVVLAALAAIKQPVRRLVVMKSALTALVLVALLSALPGWSVVHLMAAKQAVDAAAKMPVRVAESPVPTAFEMTHFNSPRSDAIAAPTLPPSSNSDAFTVRWSWRDLPWPLVAESTFAAGSAAVLFWLGIGAVAARRLRLRAAPAAHELVELFHKVAAAAPRLPQLVVSDSIDTAIALGVFQPAVVLPRAWSDQKSPQELASVLAHEWTHVKNGDLQWLAVSRALLVLLWVQPLYWLLRRRMRLDQEALADAAAADATGRQQYAAELVAWARAAIRRPRMPAAAAVGLWEGPSQLRHRIALLLDERFTVLRSCSRGWRVACSVLLVGAAVALSLVTLAAQPQLTPRRLEFESKIFQHGIERLGVLPWQVLDKRPIVTWSSGPPSQPADGVLDGDRAFPLQRGKPSIPDLGGLAASKADVFGSDRAGRLFALNSANGKPRWVYQTVNLDRAGSPLVTDDVVYYACGDGVVALSRHDGTLRWTHEIPFGGAAESSPLVVGDRLFITGYDGNMRALNANTGPLIWQRDLVSDAPGRSRGPQEGSSGRTKARPKVPASDGTTIYQPIFDQRRIVAVDCATGEVRWSFETGGWVHGNPTVHEGRVYFGSQDRFFYCLDAKTGKEIWRFATVSRIEAGAALDSGRLYFGCCAGFVYCLNLTDGKEVWRFQLDRTNGRSPIYCAPLVTIDGDLYIAGMEGQVYCLDAAKGTLRWKVRPSPGSEIDSDLATDGLRLFVTTRPDSNDNGETGIFALGTGVQEPGQTASQDASKAAAQPAVTQANEKSDAPLITSTFQKAAAPDAPLRPHTVSGRCVDENGQPLMGVEITLYVVNQIDGRHEFVRRDLSNGIGTYKFGPDIELERFLNGKPLPKEGTVGVDDPLLMVVAKLAGRATYREMHPITSIVNRGTFNQLVMKPAASLRGRVTDPNGKPVGGALVYLGTAATDRWMAVNNRWDWNHARSARTDFNGKYSIDDAEPFDGAAFKARQAALQRGAYTAFLSHAPSLISVEHPDFARKVAAFDNVPGAKDVQLELPAQIAGRVVYGDTGRPSAGVVVHASRSQPSRAAAQLIPDAELFQYQAATAKTDPDGRYLFGSLPAGEYDVWTDGEEWVHPGISRFEITPGGGPPRPAPDIKLTQGGTVRVQLVDAATDKVIPLTGKEQALLGLTPMDQQARLSRRPFIHQAAKIGADSRLEARFHAGEFRAINCDVSVDNRPLWTYAGESAQGENPAVTVVEGQTVEVKVRMAKFEMPQPQPARAAAAARRRQANFIVGHCLDENGQHLAQVDVSLYVVDELGSTGDLLARTTGDGNGNFAFPAAAVREKLFPGGATPKPGAKNADGRMLIAVAQRAGHASAREFMAVPSNLDTEIVLPFEMKPAATLRGRVTGPDDKPVAGALVFAGNSIEDRLEGIRSSRTDANGQYAINDVEPFDAAEFERQQEARRQAARQPGGETNTFFQRRPELTVEHPDFARKIVQHNSIPGDTNIKLEPPATIAGRVVYGDSGRPAAGLRVRVMRSWPSVAARSIDEWTKHPSQMWLAKTDAEGRYQVGSLPAGEYDIWPENDEWVHPGIRRFGITPPAGPDCPDIQLTKGGTLRVQLIDAATDKAIALTAKEEAMISLFALDEKSRQSGRPSTVRRVTIDADSRCEVHQFAGEFKISSCWVAADNQNLWKLEKQDVTATLKEGQTTDLRVRLVKIETQAMPATPAFRNPATQKTAAQPAVAPAPERAFEAKTVYIDLVIAKHVMLLDGKRIVTREEVEKMVAALPDPTLARPNLAFTNGASELGKMNEVGRWATRIHRFQSVWTLDPRAEVRYDAIKTAADLLPDAALRKTGIVTARDGSPLAGAQVVLLPPIPESVDDKQIGVHIWKRRLHLPINEIVTETGADGRFEYYPPQNGPYYLLALHDRGFAYVKNDAFAKEGVLRVDAWASVRGKLKADPRMEQTRAFVQADVPGFAGQPIQLIHEMDDFRTTSESGEYSIDGIAPSIPGQLRRTFQAEGTAFSPVGKPLKLAPGEAAQIELDGPSDDDMKELAKNRAAATAAMSPPPDEPQAENAQKAARDNQPIDINLIIAKHVMLLDGREIVTREDVEKKIAALPNPALVKLHLRYTNSAFQLKKEDADRPWVPQLNARFGFSGYSMGSIMPRTGVRYDAIEKPADLVPDASLRKVGAVETADGKPLAGAEVVLLPKVPESVGYTGIEVYMQQHRLRSPLDEIVTTSDESGRFTIYPPKDTPYYVLSLHERGFGMVRSDQFAKDGLVRVQPWAQITGQVKPDARFKKQSADLSLTVFASGDWPEIGFRHYAEDIKQPAADGRFDFSFVPPGIKGSLARSIKGEQGSSFSIPTKEFQLAAGGTLTLDIEPATEEEVGRINALRANSQDLLPPIEAARTAAARVASGELAGRVIDELGLPLAGVEVDVWTWHPGNETTTDADGQFSLKGFQPGEALEVEFTMKGYTPALFADQKAGTANWTIALNNHTYLEGRVLAADGQPVPNALVRAARGPIRNPNVMIGEVWSETTADAVGKYRLYLEPDTYDVQVRMPKEGLARHQGTKIAAGEKRTFDIRLQPGPVFRAQFVDSQSGEPVQGIRLWNWRQPGIEGVSNEKGELTIENMMPGRFDFNVAAAADQQPREVAGDYARWWSADALQPQQQLNRLEGAQNFQRNFDSLTFNVLGNTVPVTIFLEKAVKITGRVVDPEGEPVAGATVAPAHTGTGNSLTGDTRYSVRTNADGTFKMVLPASGLGKYNLVAHDGDYQQWRKWANGIGEVVQTRPGQKLEGIELKLTRPCVVRGKVLDAQGKPIANQIVKSQPDDWMENRYYDPATKTNDKGEFELKFVRAGEQYVQIGPPSRSPGFPLSSEIAKVTADPAQPVDGIVLKKAQPVGPR